MIIKFSVAAVVICLSSVIGVSVAKPLAGSPSSGDQDFFKCGGQLERSVWQLWEDFGREFVKSALIDKRLVGQGDTYALYDFEIGFHNLLAMARRCGRTDRSLDIARIVDSAYLALDSDTNSWICRGGAICNTQNKLLGREVMLNSAQFLAFATSVVNSLGEDRSEEVAAFEMRTVKTAVEHLLRWTTTVSEESVRRRIAAKAQNVEDGSSKLFFTDRDLWQIVIYVNIAGVLRQRPELKVLLGGTETASRLKNRFQLLLELFDARTAVANVSGKGYVAEIDRGYWRLYADARYAGYTGSNAPVSCQRDSDGARISRSVDAVTKIDVPEPEPSIGWDFSHARRLVHMFDAVDRNREAVEFVFPGLGAVLPSRNTIESYARQVRLTVWNQDAEYPLFANFLSGANGWYRVAYDNKASSCRAGVPPFGLSTSFLTGGFASWSKTDPQFSVIGKRLYFLTESEVPKDVEFMQRYYPQYSLKNRGSKENMKLTFWPSLISE